MGSKKLNYHKSLRNSGHIYTFALQTQIFLKSMSSEQFFRYTLFLLIGCVLTPLATAQGMNNGNRTYASKEIVDFREDSVFHAPNYWAVLYPELMVHSLDLDSRECTLWDTIPVNPMFMPVVFNGKILPENLNFIQPYQPYAVPTYTPELKAVDLFSSKIFNLDLSRKAHLYLMQQQPDAIKYAQDLLPTDIPVATKMKVNPFMNIFNVDHEIEFTSSEKLEITRPKRRYWMTSYETSLQFSQNHISENWHKGGKSNFNMLFFNKLNYKYEKDKVKLETNVEYKLSIYTAPTDTLRSYRIGEDVFSLKSSYGYKAFSNWYYSLSMDARTQFLNNYNENQTQKSSAFLAPSTVNFGVGMEYKLNKSFDKHKRIELSANLAPLSYDIKFIADEEVDKKRHGFKDDEKVIRNIGSRVSTSMTFNIKRNVSWNSKFFYFSNYERAEAEFENTLNLAINRYFSTRLFVNVRFDDNVKKKEPKDSYFQFYEIMSFGFNYVFR